MSILADLRQLQQQGELAQATDLCQNALTQQPNNAALLALLGVLYGQQQEEAQARHCLDSVQHATDSTLTAATLTDIAAIHLLLKEPILALKNLDNALVQQPDYHLATARRGLVLMQLGRFAEAYRMLQTAVAHSHASQVAALHINSARCALYLGENTEALQHVEQAQAHGGSQLEQWLYVAVDCYIALNQWDNAETAIYQALDAGVAELKTVKLLALVLAAQDKHGQAAHSLRLALKKQPDDVELWMQLATLARVQGHYGEAGRCLQAAIALAPDNASLWAQLTQLKQKQHDEHGAQRAAEQAVVLTEQATGLTRAEALVAIASVTQDNNQAEQYYQQALACVPDYVPACLGLGQLWLQWGRIDAAVALFESVTERHPVAGYGALINARRFPDDPAILAHIEKIAYLPSLQGVVSSTLLFDLAAAWEHQQDYAKAFHFANAANAANRKLLPYQAEHHRHQCLTIRRTFTADFFAQNSDYGNPSRVPTFILGMPRSGTTLVEQILGGHPDVFVAGEIAIMSNVIQKLNAWERHIGSGLHYPACINDLTREQSQYFANEVLEELRHYAPDAKHIVDKLPHNFEHIGLIRLLFPNAPIIHVLREPRDVAISNYFTDYQAKFGGMGFAYDLADIGAQLRDYQALMRHWDETLTTPILTIRYEDVVADTKTAAQTLLAYLNVAWTDAVLDYQNLDRAVKTASVWQVRQPIYQTSTEKWRRYQAFLAPLEAALSTPINESPQTVNAELLPAGYFFQGMALLQAKQSEQAIAVFTRLLQHHPKHAAALHMLGMAHYQQGNINLALTLVRRALALQPHHATWYQNLSLVLNALGLTTEAKAASEHALKLKSREAVKS